MSSSRFIPGPNFCPLGATLCWRSSSRAVAVPALAAKEPPRKAIAADLHQGRRADPPEAVPELPSRDQVGPFSLETYEQARKRASDIAAVAEDRPMPPWKPAAGSGPKLKHDQSLTPAEIAMLDAWAEAGAPRGDARHAPAGREVRRRLGSGHARPRPRDGRGLRRPGLGPGPLSLLRDPHQPEARRLHLGDRVPAGEPPGRPPHHGVPRHQRRGAEARRRPTRGRATRPSRARASRSTATSAAGPPATRPHHLPEGIGRPVPATPTSSSRSTTTPAASPRSTARGWRSTSARSPSSRPSTGPTPPTARSGSRRASPTSRSRPPGTSPSTSRRSPSPRTCTSSAATCG